jgi:hypothetical protein
MLSPLLSTNSTLRKGSGRRRKCTSMIIFPLLPTFKVVFSGQERVEKNSQLLDLIIKHGMDIRPDERHQ